MPRTKETTTVYLTTEQLERLKALSGQTGVPMALYIRQGVDMILAAREPRLAQKEESVHDGTDT